MIFTDAGEPTGWAMGVAPDNAIRQWLAPFRPVDQADVVRKWKGWTDRGYSVRPVDLNPADAQAVDHPGASSFRQAAVTRRP